MNMNLDPVRNITPSDPDGGPGGKDARPRTPGSPAARAYSTSAPRGDEVDIGQDPSLIANMILEKTRESIAARLEVEDLPHYEFDKKLEDEPEPIARRIATFALGLGGPRPEDEGFTAHRLKILRAAREGLVEAESVFRGLKILDRSVMEQLDATEEALGRLLDRIEDGEEEIEAPGTRLEEEQP